MSIENARVLSTWPEPPASRRRHAWPGASQHHRAQLEQHQPQLLALAARRSCPSLRRTDHRHRGHARCRPQSRWHVRSAGSGRASPRAPRTRRRTHPVLRERRAGLSGHRHQLTPPRLAHRCAEPLARRPAAGEAHPCTPATSLPTSAASRAVLRGRMSSHSSTTTWWPPTVMTDPSPPGAPSGRHARVGHGIREGRPLVELGRLHLIERHLHGIPALRCLQPPDLSELAAVDPPVERDRAAQSVRARDRRCRLPWPARRPQPRSARPAVLHLGTPGTGIPRCARRAGCRRGARRSGARSPG